MLAGADRLTSANAAASRLRDRRPNKSKKLRAMMSPDPDDGPLSYGGQPSSVI